MGHGTERLCPDMGQAALASEGSWVLESRQGDKL